MHAISVLYHEKGILVAHKPAGLATQPTRDQQENLYQLLQQKYPYVGLHHRLDTPVSGLLLFCTNRKWNKIIAQAFQNKTIKREYWAACLGNLPSTGHWDKDIDGKKARTQFHLLQKCRGYSILNITLQTGRKHQIRRHSSMYESPILGDRRYGGAAARLSKRIALHAHKITFIHPATQKECIIESAVPDILQQLREP